MIRRPMLFAACGMTAAVFLSYYGGLAAFLAGSMFLGGSLTICGGKKRCVILIILLFYLLGAYAFSHTEKKLTEEAELLSGSRLSGVITDCARKTDSAGDPCLQLTIRSQQGKVLANYYDSYETGQALEGRIADLSGEMKDPAQKRNPGCFDYALYLRTIGISKTFICDSITVHPIRPFCQAPAAYLQNLVCAIREGFIARLAEKTDPHTAALMRAIMFGDKGGLDEETIETFQKNGTAHILAVSGLHIGIIFAFISRLWRWRKGWLFFCFNLSFFLMYAAAAGFSPSVTRAVVMVLLYILAGIGGRRYDLSSGAFAVAVCILMQNPYMLFNTGFEMSFLAVLTLVLVMPYMKRFYSGVFLASLAVQIGLGPFIVYQFNYLSLLAVLINVPVVFLAGLIVPAGLVSMVSGAVDVPVAGFADASVRFLCDLLQELNTAGQMGGIASMQVPSPPLQVMAAYYAALLLFASEEGRLALIRAAEKGKYVMHMLLLIVMLSTGFHAFASDGFSKCDMVFVDVGQGDCMHLRVSDSGRILKKRNAYHVLIDGGGRENFDVGQKILRQYLLKNGVGKIDLAIVTHLHNDHYDGIRSLCRLDMVRKVCLYEGYRVRETEILEECCLDRHQLIYAAAGDRICLGDASFIMLAPPAMSEREYVRLSEDEEDENKKSLLIKTGLRGVSAMMTGDIGEDGERAAMERQNGAAMQCDILKVGHHGSGTSSSESFLDAVKPQFCVIQVGENNRYGHPAQETLQRLRTRRIPVYRNDLQGAVGVEIRKGCVGKVRTMVEESKKMTVKTG